MDWLRGISNLIAYAPVIWRDRDWDHAFLLRLLELKFFRMSEYHRKHGITESAPKIARELSSLSETCKRLAMDNYYEIAFADHMVPSGGGMLRIDSRTEWRACAELEEELRQSDLKILASKIESELLGWWD